MESSAETGDHRAEHHGDADQYCEATGPVDRPERCRGNPDRQPAQQNGSPRWNVGESTISSSHVTQLNGWAVFKRRMWSSPNGAHPRSAVRVRPKDGGLMPPGPNVGRRPEDVWEHG